MLGSDEFNKLQDSLKETREKLIKNQVYKNIKSLDDINIFMEHHIFAVWDFMSLLKALQISLTCVTVPWIPVKDCQTSHLINEIVLGEESDQLDGDHYISHFDMYKKAMKQTGAKTEIIDSFINFLVNGNDVNTSLLKAGVPKIAAEFIQSTFKFIETGKPHIIAAAFTFGREEVIPDMFKEIINDLNGKMPEKLSTFIDYLERHIHLDAEEHGPLAFKMVSNLCGNNNDKWEEVRKTAFEALEARIKLWNGISEIIFENEESYSVA